MNNQFITDVAAHATNIHVVANGETYTDVTQRELTILLTLAKELDISLRFDTHTVMYMIFNGSTTTNVVAR